MAIHADLCVPGELSSAFGSVSQFLEYDTIVIQCEECRLLAGASVSLFWKGSIHAEDGLILWTFRLLSGRTADLVQPLPEFIPEMPSKKVRTSLHYGWKLVQQEDTTGVVIPPVFHNNTWKRDEFASSFDPENGIGTRHHNLP